MLNIAAQLAACVAPESGLRALAARHEMRREAVMGTEFAHVVYRSRPAAGAVDRARETRRALHVYLEGDGRPWLRRHRTAADPTPREPLMLRLMALDPGPALYLGRPCYHGHHRDRGCEAALWTEARYSRRVVDSMRAALLRLAPADRPLVLLGHSGGGTLAVLIARELSSVRAVLTLGGNLDVADWVRRHGYTPLADSLDPARLPALRSELRQLHVVGADDDNIDPAAVARFAARQPAARFLKVPGQGHDCCWQALWPSLLETLDRLPDEG
ncbi:MAG: alpha/beta hydrolase [Gammaproteobacteria bacterium]|nr:alpha/beta hydrolase [Gammaproteobacteria bacterium]